MIKSLKKVKFLSIMPIVFSLLLSGCGSSTGQAMTEQRFLLDTIVSVTYYDPADRDAVEAALDLCGDYELVFSRTNAASELSRLNAAGTLEVSDGLLTVLEAARSECEASSGRFDITMGGVSALYDFTGEDPQPPAPAALAAAMDHVGYANIHIDGHTVTLGDPEAILDLGAAAKGFIADEMKDLLRQRGVAHAIISLGGNVLTLGGKPDGKAFNIGVQDPVRDSAGIVAAVAMTEDSLVTSGVYQRCFEADGLLWHHLLDPGSGEPIRNGLLSVSVLGPSSLRCDILSTACFALGLEAGLEHINALEGYEALFITEDGALHRSDGFPAE